MPGSTVWRKIVGQGTAPCSSRFYGKPMGLPCWKPWKLKPVAWRTSDKHKTTFWLQGLVLAQYPTSAWVRHCRMKLKTSDFELCSGNPATQTGLSRNLFLYKISSSISCCSMPKPPSCTLILPGFCSRLVSSCLQCSQDNLTETLLNHQYFVPRSIPGCFGQKMMPFIRTSFVVWAEQAPWACFVVAMEHR